MANNRTTKKTRTKRAAERTVDESPLGDEIELGRDMLDYLREYAREKPEVAALWCLGIGFILGWKLKPW
jgi:hypothetical protein